MANRNPVKQLFITFPHSTVDKQTFRDTLLRFDPDYYKVCEEKHKDGTPHLHAVVRFKNKYSKTFILNYYKELYPDDYKRIDIKPIRSIKNAINYLSKEDGDPLESGPFSDHRNPQRSLGTKFARELGYNTIQELANAYTKEQAEIQDSLGKIIEYHRYFSSYPEYSPPFEILRRMDKNPILKDDITYLKDYFKIKE